MPRAARICAQPGCTTITRTRHCNQHQPTSIYDANHRALRRQWLPHVEAGHVNCWRCGETILPGEPWDLGHDQGEHAGPEHANRCNRRAAALDTSRAPGG